jgi:hypothetical protein
VNRRWVAAIVTFLGVGAVALTADSARSTVRSNGQIHADGASRKGLRFAQPRLDAGLIRTGSNNWHTLKNVNRYGLIIAGSANATPAGHQPGRALTWGCGVSIGINNTWNDAVKTSCGIPWRVAVANDWVLKGPDGNYVRYGECSRAEALMDVGNAAYQKAFIARMKEILQWHRGIDGVFIDDIQGSTLGKCTTSVKYPSDAAYREAILSFIRSVGPSLRAKGWYVAVNASIHDPAAESFTGSGWDGTQYIWWARQLVPYVDGINMEHWQQNWDDGDSVRVSGELGTQAWDGWERVPYVLQSLKTDFYAMEAGSLTDVKKASYLRASFLLAWRPGTGAFLYTDNYAGQADPWNLTASPHVGRPKSGSVRVGVGFRRTFTKGSVILNPNPSQAQQFSFTRPHLLPDGTRTRSVTLPPATGLVLRTG